MRKTTEEIADLENELQALRAQRRELLGWAYIGAVNCKEAFPSYEADASAMFERIVRGEFGSVAP